MDGPVRRVDVLDAGGDDQPWRERRGRRPTPVRAGLPALLVPALLVPALLVPALLSPAVWSPAVRAVGCSP